MSQPDVYAYTFVNATDGTIRVHRHLCADITRREKNGAWNVRAVSVEAAIEQERRSLGEEFGSDADNFEFVVLPCAKYAWKWQGRTVPPHKLEPEGDKFYCSRCKFIYATREAADDTPCEAA